MSDAGVDPVAFTLASHQNQLNDVRATLVEQQKILSSHTTMLSTLADDFAAQEGSMDKFYNKLSELHGENRARSEVFERLMLQQDVKTSTAIRQLDERLIRLGSIKQWIAWVLIISTSSGVFAVISHFFKG